MIAIMIGLVTAGLITSSVMLGVKLKNSKKDKK
jgi:hypothetical protein